MERYEKYKDSGVEWIGEIPEGWVVKKLKCFISKAGSGITPRGGASVYQLTGIPLLRSQNIHFGGLKLDDVAYITQEMHDEMSNSKVFSGDILLNITGASIGRCYYVTDSLGEANVNQHVCILRPIKKISTEFLYFILRSDIGQEQINLEQTGSGREGLNFEALKNFLIPSIGLDEQTAIANYLNSKTAQIDELIAQKERLIELYEEEKAAIINQAVTKGIDPDVRLKESGIEWLGETPVGWEVKRLKYTGKFINGFSFSSTDFISRGIRVLKISNIQHMRIDWSDSSFVDEMFYEKQSYFRVYKNDLVFALTRPIISTGIKAAIIDTEERILLNQRNSIFRAEDIKTEWIYFLLLSKQFINDFDIRIDKTGQQPNISSNDIGDISIPVPLQKDQTIIILHIETEIARIDVKIAKTKKIIALQKEYRTALISEVVTGKVKIPQETKS